MSFDFALNRLDHDLEFQEIPPVITQTIWDASLTTWDGGATIWDEVITGETRYSFWLINNADKTAQQIKMTLLAFLGEWFLDTTFGVPYLEDILVKNPRMSSVETILRGHILDVPDVIRIDSFSLDWDRKNRILGVEFTCETINGPVQDSVKLEMFRPNRSGA